MTGVADERAAAELAVVAVELDAGCSAAEMGLWMGVAKGEEAWEWGNLASEKAALEEGGS